MRRQRSLVGEFLHVVAQVVDSLPFGLTPPKGIPAGLSPSLRAVSASLKGCRNYLQRGGTPWVELAL